MWRTVFFPYISYVSLFLGMGLISGAIVHMPMDPVRYTLIMLIGAGMFGFASFVNDLRGKGDMSAAEIAQALLYSLLLSVGIGMVSGGIQHFSDNPPYSAMLIPMGFGISLFSFILKSGVVLSVKRVYAVIALFIILVLPLKVGLDYVVGAAPAAAAESHGGH